MTTYHHSFEARSAGKLAYPHKSRMASFTKITIPEEVSHITDTLQNAGFEAYLVGGCVRDLLREKTPKDWDITTNATPEEVQELFEHTYYENRFGTVGVVNDETEDETLKHVEVTTYRLESSYSDQRHPDKVVFSKNLEDDLKRRDFTMNALALAVPKGKRSTTLKHLVDPHNGLTDIHNKQIKAVGTPEERFREDALRMLRAVRFATELDFIITRETGEAIQKTAQQIDKIAKERIREELVKIIMSDNPERGFELLHDLKLLAYIVPELEEAIGVEQNQAHTYTVWEHLLKSLQAAAEKGWGLELRLTALLHDIAKPRTREHDPKKDDWSFHGHEVVGARMTHEILKHLRFPNETIKTVRKLVRWHMFFSDPDEISLSAVRRMIRNVGKERIWDLMNVRIADRVGTGRPKEQPYRFRKYQSMIDEALRDPVSVGMLALDGEDIMQLTGEKPGPKIGWVLHALLEEVLDDPSKNTKKYLEKRALELVKLPKNKLKELGEAGKEKQLEEEERELKKIRDRYWVK